MAKKLRELGLDLPLLSTSSVGSLPKPADLVLARARACRKEIAPGELDAVARQATEFWIRQQEEIGVDILVDGEMYRGDLVAYFAGHLGGFREGGLVRVYGNRYYRKPVISGAVHWKGPITVEWWKYAQSLTPKPVKGMITGAYTMMDWSFDGHYPGRKSAAITIARELRREAEALVQAGCKIIQIDEPALSARPGELPVVMEAVRIMTEKLPAYFIVHACYGAFEPILPEMLGLAADNIGLEMSGREPGLLDLFAGQESGMDISIGVTDVHTHKAPTVDMVRKRLKKALAVFKPEQVWIGPDCGLKTRTVDEAVTQLKVIQEAVMGMREDQ